MIQQGIKIFKMSFPIYSDSLALSQLSNILPQLFSEYQVTANFIIVTQPYHKNLQFKFKHKTETPVFGLINSTHFKAEKLM